MTKQTDTAPERVWMDYMEDRGGHMSWCAVSGHDGGIPYVREDTRTPVSDGCPCLYTTPCQPNCTCVHPHMSHGCFRCARYGSVEQQKAAAERLAALMDTRTRSPVWDEAIEIVRNNSWCYHDDPTCKHAADIITALEAAKSASTPDTGADEEK